MSEVFGEDLREVAMKVSMEVEVVEGGGVVEVVVEVRYGGDGGVEGKEEEGVGGGRGGGEAGVLEEEAVEEEVEGEKAVSAERVGEVVGAGAKVVVGE